MKTILFVNLRTHKVERLIPLRTAKKMGLKVVLLCDKDPNVDRELYHDLIVADTYQFEAVLEQVKQYNQSHPLAGVVTWSDKDVELVSRIAEALKLPGLSPESARLARNKYLMRQALSKVEGLCPAYRLVENYEQLQEAFNTIGAPAIFKPVGASGSKAIFKVEPDSNLEEIYRSMIQSTRPDQDKIYSFYPGQYVYEEFIDGPEVSVEGFVQKDTVYIAGVVDKAVTPAFSVEVEEYFPSNKSLDTITEIKTKATQAAQALGLNHCAFHIECRVSPAGVRIIEVAARPAGGFITSHLIELASGYSFHEQVIHVALGEPVQWHAYDEVAFRYAGHMDLLATKAGVITKAEGWDIACEQEGYIFALPIKKTGDHVGLPPKDYAPYLATMVAVGDSYEELQRNLLRIRDSLQYEIE